MVALADSVEDPPEASLLCNKVALADSVEDPLEASPLCSKVALADSVEDPLEASAPCSKVALADPVQVPPGTLPGLILKLLHLLRICACSICSLLKHVGIFRVQFVYCVRVAASDRDKQSTKRCSHE